MSELAATYENFAERESVKLWRRDWDNFPGKALVRLQEEGGHLAWSIGWRDPVDRERIVGDWPSGWKAIGWYPEPNAESDAAYGDPGEGTGSQRKPGEGTGV